MRDNRLLRLLTVVLLATWSPGSWWCCCRAQAAEPVPQEVQASSCCAAAEAPAPIPPTDTGDGCGDNCCPLIPSEAPSCGCQHGVVDAALPAATTVPATDDGCGLDLDLLVELPPDLGAVTAPGRLGLTCRGSPRRAPARSLLFLHCMLTT